MQSKTALVLGVANKKSLAWSSALSLLTQGDFQHVIVTFQNERFKSSIESMVHEQNAMLNHNFKNIEKMNPNQMHKMQPKSLSCLQCDVSDENNISAMFQEAIPELLKNYYQRHRDNNDNDNSSQDGGNKLHAMIHSIAYAPADAMKPSSDTILPFLQTSKESFRIAHDISSYSLLSLARHALPLLSNQYETEQNLQQSTTSTSEPPLSSSITALTYLGSSYAVPNYNIMGPAKASLEATIKYLASELSSSPHSIRVNGVSAGPVNTLAARGIAKFTDMKRKVEQENMLKRNVTAQEVGNVVAFLSDSERSSGITGQIIFCDGGYSSCR